MANAVNLDAGEVLLHSGHLVDSAEAPAGGKDQVRSMMNIGHRHPSVFDGLVNTPVHNRSTTVLCSVMSPPPISLCCFRIFSDCACFQKALYTAYILLFTIDTATEIGSLTCMWFVRLFCPRHGVGDDNDDDDDDECNDCRHPAR